MSTACANGCFRLASSDLAARRSLAGDAAVARECRAARRQSRNFAVAASAAALPVSHKATESSSAAALAAFRASQASAANRYASEPKNVIVSMGLTIHSAPVSLREKLAVPAPEWPRAIQELCQYPHIEEAAVLSTCNRFEIYAVAASWHRGVREIEEWMCQSSGVSIAELRPHLFLLRDRDATSHLLKVSAGLDSLVLGEGQILAQVKDVLRYGQEAGPGFGRCLTGLFKQAITAGKRVRSETAIASGAVSVSSAAVELAQLKLPGHSWAGTRVAIVGAGKMSTLLVKHLASKGCTSLTLLNRSRPRAEELQAAFPEVAMRIELMPELHRVVAASDVVFTASSSETVLLSKAELEGMPACPASVGGVRRLFDISVPRNVAADVNDMASAHVFNVDDLKEVVAANKSERGRAATEAEGLLTEERQSFEAWRDSLETVPTIKRLRGKAENIRLGELEKSFSKLGETLTKKQRQVMEEMSKGITNKLLHGPMQALRSDGTDAAAVTQTLENMHALEIMFDLSSELKDEADRKREIKGAAAPAPRAPAAAPAVAPRGAAPATGSRGFVSRVDTDVMDPSAVLAEI